MALEEGGGSAAARRKPSWRERENNRRRERRRRAIAAKIFGGLRARGNFNLPKHCDNNEVLKSLCKEAGWVVEEDGTTYRKGCERPPPMDVVGTSNDVTPYASQLQSPMSSAFQTPIPSYQVSPSSSMCPSPSHFPGTPSAAQFPFFYNTLMSSLPPLRISNSCPVTPPPSSPNSKAPPKSVNWEVIVQEPVNSFKYPIFAASAPASPIRHQLFTPATIPECDESDSSTVDSGHWASFRSQMPFGASASPTFNLIKRAEQVRIGNGVDLKGKGLAVDVGKGLNVGLGIDLVKPWEGERISEFGFDDLELTLGSGKTHTEVRFSYSLARDSATETH